MSRFKVGDKVRSKFLPSVAPFEVVATGIVCMDRGYAVRSDDGRLFTFTEDSLYAGPPPAPAFKVGDMVRDDDGQRYWVVNTRGDKIHVDPVKSFWAASKLYELVND